MTNRVRAKDALHSSFSTQDTSATNFMIRDARMQQLVATEKEPITPFISKVRNSVASYKNENEKLTRHNTT